MLLFWYWICVNIGEICITQEPSTSQMINVWCYQIMCGKRPFKSIRQTNNFNVVSLKNSRIWFQISHHMTFKKWSIVMFRHGIKKNIYTTLSNKPLQYSSFSYEAWFSSYTLTGKTLPQIKYGRCENVVDYQLKRFAKRQNKVMLLLILGIYSFFIKIIYIYCFYF